MMTGAETFVDRRAPVPCAGCGELTAYEASEDDSQPSYAEWLGTPFGYTMIRTHRVRECVLMAREKLEGKKIPRPLTREEKDHLRAEQLKKEAASRVR